MLKEILKGSVFFLLPCSPGKLVGIELQFDFDHVKQCWQLFSQQHVFPSRTNQKTWCSCKSSAQGGPEQYICRDSFISPFSLHKFTRLWFALMVVLKCTRFSFQILNALYFKWNNNKESIVHSMQFVFSVQANNFSWQVHHPFDLPQGMFNI